jgi:hypothetical protein
LSQSQESRPASLPPLYLVGVPLAAKIDPILAAFAALKTRAHYAILSLGQNKCSIFTRAHNERIIA